LPRLLILYFTQSRQEYNSKYFLSQSTRRANINFSRPSITSRTAENGRHKVNKFVLNVIEILGAFVPW
jgi:hypothetical protein